MSKFLWIGGSLLSLILFVGMCTVAQGRLKEADREREDKATPVADVGNYLKTPEPTPSLLGKPAVWQGYPIKRPAWCSSGKWVMVEAGMGPVYIVPGCVTPLGTAILGSWHMTGCAIHQPPGEDTRPDGVIVTGRNSQPNAEWYTICPPKGAATPVPPPSKGNTK